MSAQRLRCTRCTRPLAHCLCDQVNVVEHRTRILVLQHPDEQSHPFNTARLAVMSLAYAQCRVGEVFPELPDLLAQSQHPALLFPGPHAVDPAQWGPLRTRPEPATDENDGNTTIVTAKPPDLLIVPDGTWRQAGRLVRINPVLHTLPRLCLPPGEPSAYQIRRTHRPGAISTLEAIVRTLSALEPDTDLQPVIALFEQMIASQVQAQQRGQDNRNRVANRCNAS